MNRALIRRLEELEERTGVTRDEYERALERMRCRYLLLLEAQRRARWEIARDLRPVFEEAAADDTYESLGMTEEERDQIRQHIKKAVPDETYEPREMTEDQSEKVGQHMRTFRLPCSSLKPLAEAEAYLGVDSRERILEDLEALYHWEKARQGTGVIGFHWERWIADKYTPTMNAIEAWDEKEDFVPLLDLRFAKIAENKADSARRAASAASGVQRGRIVIIDRKRGGS